MLKQFSSFDLSLGSDRFNDLYVECRRCWKSNAQYTYWSSSCERHGGRGAGWAAGRAWSEAGGRPGQPTLHTLHLTLPKF